ncbi:MAG: hypothetical protein JWR07_3302 [Nevskia sp.]|nr:hypothetical protein [Nevskia sp.]
MIFARTILSLCLFGLASFSAWASDAPQVAELTGKWTGSENFPNGARLETVVSLNPDMTFVGSATVNKKPFWDYSGTWKLDGNKIVWTYINSSRPLPEAAKIDVDGVVSVGKSELVLKSQSSGKEHTFERSE